MVFLLLQLLIFFFFLFHIFTIHYFAILTEKIVSQNLFSTFSKFIPYFLRIHYLFCVFRPIINSGTLFSFLNRPFALSSPSSLYPPTPVLDSASPSPLPPPPPFPLLPLPNSPAYQVSNKKANSFLLLRRLAKISTIYSGQ